jgi:hypothetical protein
MFLIHIFIQASTITIFVLVMMLVIEYLTVRFKSNKSGKFTKNPWVHIVLAAILGIIPGCLGSFAVVSMYIHRTIGLAALVTNLIATSGDEGFIMFAVIPDTAVKLTVIIFIISIVAGIIVQLIFKDRKYIGRTMEHKFIHTNEPECVCYDPKKIIPQLKKIIPQRLVLVLIGLGMASFLIFKGNTHEHRFSLIDTKYFRTENNTVIQVHDTPEVHTESAHDHENEQHAESSEDDHEAWGWERITFLFITAIGLFIVVTVPDHFFKKHLWDHVIKKHFLRLFIWTLSVFVVLHFLNEFLDVKEWIEGNIFLIIIIAGLIGLIPESGPHIIFISLFASGVIPFAVLLTNSIVQDGHGALPLLAESGKSFIVVKLINFFIGIIAGYLFILI